jgi:hypothetical protein
MRQEGRVCVFPLDVVLPDVCVKCGSTQAILRKRKRYEYAPLRIFTTFIGEPPAPRRVKMDLPICTRCASLHGVVRALLGGAWALVLGTWLLIALAPQWIPEGVRAWVAISAWAAVPVVGLLHLLFGSSRMLPDVVRIDDKTIALAHLGRAGIKRLLALAQHEPPKKVSRS